MSKTPKIPADQTSPAAGGDFPSNRADETHHASSGLDRNLEQQGQPGNISQNTTHQGLPRDREPT